MKAPSFGYCRPSSIEEACKILAEHGSDARILAGGQSMMAALNLRLSAPALLVDINRIAELEGIVVATDGSYLHIKALVRHAEIASSPLVVKHLPLVAAAMRHVAHPAIRNRGTTCGSLAHADPSSEMPACAVALNAVLVLQSWDGGVRQVRTLRADEFFLGLFETARREDELLIEVMFPCRAPNEVYGFDELSRRHGDFAMVGVAIKATFVNGLISNLRLVTFATEPMPILSVAASKLAEGQPWSPALGKAIAEAVVREINPDDNLFGSPAIKRVQAAALIRRVLTSTFTENAQTGNYHG